MESRVKRRRRTWSSQARADLPSQVGDSGPDLAHTLARSATQYQACKGAHRIGQARSPEASTCSRSRRLARTRPGRRPLHEPRKGYTVGEGARTQRGTKDTAARSVCQGGEERQCLRAAAAGRRVRGNVRVVARREGGGIRREGQGARACDVGRGRCREARKGEAKGEECLLAKGGGRRGGTPRRRSLALLPLVDAYDRARRVVVRLARLGHRPVVDELEPLHLPRSAQLGSSRERAPGDACTVRRRPAHALEARRAVGARMSPEPDRRRREEAERAGAAGARLAAAAEAEAFFGAARDRRCR